MFVMVVLSLYYLVDVIAKCEIDCFNQRSRSAHILVTLHSPRRHRDTFIAFYCTGHSHQAELTRWGSRADVQHRKAYEPPDEIDEEDDQHPDIPPPTTQLQVEARKRSTRYNHGRITELIFLQLIKRVSTSIQKVHVAE